MTSHQTAIALVGLALLCLVLGVALLAAVLRLRAAGARSRAEIGALRERLDRLEAREVREAGPEAPVEFVITDLGQPGQPEPEPVPLDSATFADVVLRETVVRAASLAHGVRRGLAPATRHRIRFEMKQEVRRVRKQRRADHKVAQRDLHARQRAAPAEEAAS